MSDAATGDTPALAQMTPEESRAYWDQRHAQADDLASGGNIGYDRGTNAMLYVVRTARLIEVLGAGTDSSVPLRVLDAGCGKGYFSRQLAGFGHRVDGIDTSAHAIDLCRAGAGPSESYAVSELSRWSPPHLYDAVVCIDVLYHLMDDAEWEASVRNLASLVRLGGIIGLVDHDRDEDRVWRDYQKTRAVSRYRNLLQECGFEVRRFVRNAFKNDPSGMHVAVRVA
ncbi:MAG TPA: class I SAM-dependent methyltransferase [Dermatophilaceae bacterium]|nr:class I SAM-dependent methyltransferase [Dermatophilaceae bacterium]